MEHYEQLSRLEKAAEYNKKLAELEKLKSGFPPPMPKRENKIKIPRKISPRRYLNH